MIKVYSLDGITPVVHPTAYVHPSAVLIGDVIVGPGCYIGPSASLRGDFGRLIVEERANIQDCCVMHGFPIPTPWWGRTGTSATEPSFTAARSAATPWWA
jgi:phenylacetic acid degradation protein